MHLREFLKNNQSDIVLFVGVILIGLVSFGAGRLTAPQPIKEPIAIDESQVANIGQTFLKPEAAATPGAEAASNQTANQPNNTNTEQNQNQGRFVASRSGSVYHWPWCSWAQKIKPENQIWFATEAEAQKAGYKRCSKFLELAPADYRSQ